MSSLKAASGPRRRVLAALVMTTVLAVAAGLLGQGTTPTPAPPSQLDSILPTSGALLGAWATSRQGPTPDREKRMQGFEALVGRKMAVERVYYFWFEEFPTFYDYQARDDGRTLILSWGSGSRDGAPTPWSDVASGRYDELIDARAAGIKAFAAPMYFVFHHEPNGKHKAGTPQEFVAAYRRVHDRFVAAGVTNVLYGMVMFDSSFQTGQIDAYYPGDDYVDVVGADVFNWFGCPGRSDPWTSFRDKAGPFHEFVVAHHKVGIVAEWGSNEDPAIPGRKAQWILEAGETLKTWPEVKAVAYFDARHAPGCFWLVDTSPSSLAAFHDLAEDPYFNPARAPSP